MTATTTYLQIVNSSINESGADSATFAVDGSDFTTRTDKYMNQFKTWVSRAWRDIQIECYDWEFMQEQGLCTLNPGLMCYADDSIPHALFPQFLSNDTITFLDQDGTTALSSLQIINCTDLTGVYTNTQNFIALDLGGYTSADPLNIALKPGAEYFVFTNTLTTFTGSSTSGTATVGDLLTLTFTDGTVFTGLAVFDAYDTGTHVIGFHTANNNLSIKLATNMGFTITDPSAGSFTTTYIPGTLTQSILNTGKVYLHSWRSYDFNEETQSGDFQENIEEINKKSFRSIDYLQSPPAGEIPIPFMPWETFRSSYDISSSHPGTPRLITEDDTGRYRFFPALYYPYSIKFDYGRRPQILSAFGDIPRGINDEFTDLIMWRAINYYGEYMEQPSIIARSERRYKDLLSRLEQKNREMFHFKPAKLW